MNRPHIAATRRFAIAVMGLMVLAFPASASAGRVLVSGHDADHHCGRPGISVPHKQCHFFQVAVEYVRAGAPDPTKPLLVLDRRDLDVVTSLDRVYGPGVVPRTVLDPRSDEFRRASISTNLYSAVVIASSGGDPDDESPQDLNEVGSAPDSEAINARADDLRAFFNTGGGLFVNAGNVHGDSTDDPYYRFLPLAVRGALATAPFALTDVGRSLGLVDEDVTCCPTHNTFAPPESDSVLRPVDTDAEGRIVTLVGEAQRYTSLGEAPVTPRAVEEIAAGVPESGSCVRRSTLSLKVRRTRGLRYRRATVYLDGKRVKRLKGRRVTRRFKLAVPASAGEQIRVRIVVLTTGKRKITIRRTYRSCQ